MAKIVEPIRLSAWQFAQHIGKTQGAVSAALKSNDIAPDKSGHYSLRDLVRSLIGTGLGVKARDARYQEQIDKATITADKVALNRKELMPTEVVRQAYEDIQTKLVQIIRHSKLSTSEKDILYRQIGELKL